MPTLTAPFLPANYAAARTPDACVRPTGALSTRARSLHPLHPIAIPAVVHWNTDPIDGKLTVRAGSPPHRGAKRLDGRHGPSHERVPAV
jgi:hypothetical protein